MKSERYTPSYFFFDKYLEHADEWAMWESERVMLSFFLQNVGPEVAIEIGTLKAGSLSLISKFSEKVYSLDIDAECKRSYSDKFPNVEFIIGDSKETLPALVNSIETNNERLSFVLIDGDHTKAGALADINNILRIHPVCECFVLIHDSLNPQVRQGILGADWEFCPYVQFVEIDYLFGHLDSAPLYYRTMWGGFALAILTPEKRNGKLTIRQPQKLQFNSTKWSSVHYNPLWRWVNTLRGRFRAQWAKCP